MVAVKRNMLYSNIKINLKLTLTNNSFVVKSKKRLLDANGD
jgi:hypothetical protein